MDEAEKQKRPFLATEVPPWQMLTSGGSRSPRDRPQGVRDPEPGTWGHHLRDLTDEINKLIREKGHWEDRILELGGPNYKKLGPPITDAEGKPMRTLLVERVLGTTTLGSSQGTAR